MTLYPYLDSLITTLTSGLKLEFPIVAYANLEQVTIQGAPMVCLIADDTRIMETIKNVRSIKALRLYQEWTVMTILRDAGDQKVTNVLLKQLGEWQATILNLLCRELLTVGGPLQVIDLPKPESIDGGAIAGRIRLGVNFVLNAE